MPRPQGVSVPRHPVPLPPRRLLALAVAIAATAPLHAADLAAGTACPLGSIVCAKPSIDYSQCPVNPLMADYVPDLPTAGDRAAAPTAIRARRSDSSDGREYTLTGDVSLQRLDQLLRADRIDYDRDSTAYAASGNVRYQDHALLLRARSIHGTTTPDRATASKVQYLLLAAHGNGTAGAAEILDRERSAYSDATYSTCDPRHRLWEMSARRIDIDSATGIGRARDVSMRIKGVPFFWLPYLRFPANGQRMSGLLAPSFGVSSNSGFFLRLPYYLNLAPNYDATVIPQIYGDRGAMLGGQFRYLTESSHGTVNADYMPHDRLAGGQRWSLQAQDSTVLGNGWSFNANINRVSDSSYFEDFGNSLTLAATSLLGSSAYLYGSGSWWNASLGIDTFQLTDPTLPYTSLPYARLPRATFNADLPLAGALEFGLRSEAVAFRKRNALEGDRLDLYPYLALPLQGAAWFVRPELGYRYTTYQLQQAANASPDRGLPIASVNAGLVFDRDVRLFGNDYTQTLEPQAYYLYVPYRNQNNLPVFDTQPLTFDYWQMFSSNTYSGADRQINANNLTLALTSRLLDAGGVERLSASLGEILYFTPQRVTLPGMPPATYSRSNYVGTLSVALSPDWRLDVAQQYDPNAQRMTVSTIGVQRRIGGDGVFNFAYRYRRGLLDQYDVSALWPLNASWSLIGRWNYSLRNHSTLEALGGVEWDSCCMAVRVVARHYVRDFAGDTSNAIMFEVEFKGLGDVGQKTGDFLRRAILGYQ